MDFTWARLAEIGVTPDYDKRARRDDARPPTACSRWRPNGRRPGSTVLRAKWIEQNEGPGKIESSVAKAMGGALARKATQTCIAVLGACGLSEEHLPEKAFRDARIFDIYEGDRRDPAPHHRARHSGLLAEGAELN